MDYQNRKWRKLRILFDDSSSDDDEIEDEISKPNKIPHILLNPDDDDDSDIEEITAVAVYAIENLIREDRTKITDYVEKTVPNYSDRDFIMHFRLPRTLVKDLTQRFENWEPYVELTRSSGKPPLPSNAHLLSFLWFVGHQDGYRAVADRFGITLSTLFQVITRVCEFVLSFSSDVIKLPTDQQKAESAAYFLQRKRFPNVIGAVDGTHIKINKPKYDPDSYYTRKKEFAVHVQGVVNEKKKFIDVFAGYPGSVHDARVFRECDLFPALPELCSGAYTLLADSAYPLRRDLIVPYRDNGHLTRRQRTFNFVLSSCRIVVEHAFGQLKQRFRQLYHVQLRNYHRIVKLIYVCCVLHNLADEDDLRFLEPPENTENDQNAAPNQPNQENVENQNVASNQHRNELCEIVYQMNPNRRT